MTPETKKLAELIVNMCESVFDDRASNEWIHYGTFTQDLSKQFESAVRAIILEREASLTREAEAGMEAMGFQREDTGSTAVESPITFTAGDNP